MLLGSTARRQPVLRVWEAAMSRSVGLPVVIAAVALACARGEPIRVGMVSGLTGRHSDLGISSRNGATLAISEINDAGGIAGRRLELVVRDDGQDPEHARRAVSELVHAGVVAMIGHVTSSM